jgi:hypothetical protein
MKLTKKKFNTVISNIKISERTRLMSYEILVNQKSSEEVGRKFGVTRQAAHKAALRVWRSYLESIDCPEGWTSIELIVPPELKERFEKIQQQLLIKHSIL